MTLEQNDQQNEELLTINDELSQRTNDLIHANAFLQSVLGSLSVAVIAIDYNYNILTWNEKAEDLWGLRSDEVHGRSLLGLDIGLPVEQLKAPIRMVLSGEVACHEILLDATNRRGKALRCQVTINSLVGRVKKPQGAILLVEEARNE